MKKLLISSCLLILSCGPVISSVCSTTCGLQYQGRIVSKEADYSCADIQRIEDRLVTALTPQYPLACRALNNWDVWNHAEAKWTDYWGRSVAGLTNCKNFQSEIGLAATLSDSALAHEMIHMVQSCYGGQAPFDSGMDAYHGDWTRRGLFVLIDEINK